MNGYGSGNHSERHGRRGNTNEYRQLDSFYFGKFVQNISTKNRESVNTPITFPGRGKIGSTIYKDRLEIAYKIKTGTEKESIRDIIHFSRIPNHYGGADRVYFTCPNCNRRARYLYLVPPRFKCRVCVGLNYDSQQKTKTETLAAYKILIYVQEKFRDEPEVSMLTIADYVPPRPKGMHRITYERYLDRLARLQEEFLAVYSRRRKR